MCRIIIGVKISGSDPFLSGRLELLDDTHKWNAEDNPGVWHLHAAYKLSWGVALGFLKAIKCVVGA